MKASEVLAEIELSNKIVKYNEDYYTWLCGLPRKKLNEYLTVYLEDFSYNIGLLLPIALSALAIIIGYVLMFGSDISNFGYAIGLFVGCVVSIFIVYNIVNKRSLRFNRQQKVERMTDKEAYRYVILGMESQRFGEVAKTNSLIRTTIERWEELDRRNECPVQL